MDRIIDEQGKTGEPRRGAFAVMQPYFFPYAGYFCLLAAVETFVIFDDVQFPRRGRVHRCEVPGPDGTLEWLTLPLARQQLDTLIKDVAFATGARAMLDRRLARLPWLHPADGPWAGRVRAHLCGPLASPSRFVEEGIRLVAKALELRPRLIRSSTIDIDQSLRGPDRILAIGKALGGRTYINAPGGMELRFLAPYGGAPGSILPALMGDIDALRIEVRRSTSIDKPRQGSTVVLPEASGAPRFFGVKHTPK
jgi:WbqC-like protein family